MTSLFDPIRIGDLDLANRIVMAPLTRCRAPGTVPTPLMAQYYAQRADPASGAGLIIAEATQIRPDGQGYLDTPGIHSAEQVRGWRQVTDAVHARGGRIALQLWHVGRISHASLQPGGGAPLSSSTRAAQTKTLTRDGFQPCSTPRALGADELPALIADYAKAAAHAMEAGFDAVEVHAANGYLIEQFLRDSVNDRQDGYGGPIANRARLLHEVMRAVAGAVGGGRTGVRLSPITPANDCGQDSDAPALYAHAAAGLAPLQLAWVHLIEGATGGARDLTDQGVPAIDYTVLRDKAHAPWMVNNGYTREMALDAVASGRADLVAFGRPFIGNPDLGRRLREGADLATSDRRTYYGGGAAGYTDYHCLP
jgi:N-ethylmaleimide reductase